MVADPAAPRSACVVLLESDQSSTLLPLSDLKTACTAVHPYMAELKGGDREFLMEAVKQDGLALEDASAEQGGCAGRRSG